MKISQRTKYLDELDRVLVVGQVPQRPVATGVEHSIERGGVDAGELHGVGKCSLPQQWECTKKTTSVISVRARAIVSCGSSKRCDGAASRVSMIVFMHVLIGLEHAGVKWTQ